MSRSNDRWRLIRLLAFLALGLLLAACSEPAPGLSEGGAGGTGISVAPEFEVFYEENGGARVFGFPISNPFFDSESGRLVQYFQQLHLAYDQVAGVVSVRPLGDQFVPGEEEQVPVPGSGNGRERIFPDSGIVVQDEFLTFYEANGDELIFGRPITPQLNEGGKLVQYFENAQLVWNPNALPEFRVEIASLGSAYLWQFGSPVGESFGVSDSAAVLEADVRATIKEPILYAGETQVLYVSVITPDSLQLVEGATVRVAVSYGGLTSEIVLSPTDANGQTQRVLDLPGVEPGQKVQLEIEAIGVTGASLGETTLSFQTWW